MSAGLRRAGAGGAVALLWLAVTGCSALDETWLATTPLQDLPPREVHAQFTGNRGISNRTLRATIRPDMSGLSQGLEADAAAYDAADAIAEYYRSRGFPDATASYRVEGPTVRQGEPDLVVVHFAIDEGEAVTVAGLDLVGNQRFPDRELLPLWARRNSGTLGLGDPYLVHADLRAFAAEIRDHYWRHGWLEATVDGPDVERAPRARTARVALHVREGRQFRFGRVTVAEALAKALGDALPKLPAGEVFTTMRAQELLLAVRSALLRRGHPQPRVGIPPLPDVTQLAAPVIDLELQGEPGPTAVVGAIEVTGNERTRTGRITGELGFAAGKPFDGIEEQQALARLYRTGLFQRVTIEHGELQDGKLPVRVHVEELDAQSVEALVGYGSYEQLRSSVRWEDRNLFGTGREMAIEGRVSQKGYRASTTLTDRDLFDTDITGTLGAEIYDREHPSFRDRAAGASTALRRTLAEYLVGRVGYSWLDHATRNETLGPSPTDDYTNGAVFVELRRDDRDNVVLPNAGSVLFVRGDFTNQAFGADLDFNRLRTGVACILPLGDSTRLGFNAELGWLWSRQDSASLPLSERFFNGGYDSVRSFEQDELGPQDAAGNPVGGEFRNLFSVELRQQFYGPLEVSLFADAGNVGANVGDYGFDDMGYALGAGLRLQLPIGPVRFDAGWNPDRRPGDEAWVFHFAVGYPF